MDQENNMKNLFYLLIVLLISGCSLKQEVTDTNSYSIDFNSKNKSYKNIKPLKLDETLKLFTNNGFFELEKIKKLVVLKEKF